MLKISRAVTLKMLALKRHQLDVKKNDVRVKVSCLV